MGLFSGIVKAVSGVVKGAVNVVKNTVSSVIKKPLPTILSVAKSLVPGVSAVSNLAAKVAGHAQNVTGFAKAVQAELGKNPPPAAAADSGTTGGAGTEMVRAGSHVWKVVIFR